MTVVAPGSGTSERDPSGEVLRVTVSGGGPVGLAFALMLDDLLGDRASITVYDRRWTRQLGPGGTSRVVWTQDGASDGRRQQVVTLQSRQWSGLPPDVQRRLFDPGTYSEMWPVSADSVDDLPPRNLRIAHVEDHLLAAANDRSDRLALIPERFRAAEADGLDQQHVLAICEGSRSRTRGHFSDRFGVADTSMYALDGRPVRDVVLGLRVASDLADPFAVLLTVAQNRFLLNSVHGKGFLNMRLTDAEAAEAVGVDLERRVFARCVQRHPCLMAREADEVFGCAIHGAYFLPALLKRSPLWERVEEGLRLYDIREENLTAVTCYQVHMVQRPRFSAELLPRTSSAPGTFGFLLGDAANAIHVWPGRGLNSGLASAVSLARDLANVSRLPLRDADFVRHEAVMAMLQYRHKTRAWRQMVSTDEAGRTVPIKTRIAQAIEDGGAGEGRGPQGDPVEAMTDRMLAIRARLGGRLPGLPDSQAIRRRLTLLSRSSLHTLLASGAWDFADVGGEEVDVDWLLPSTST